MRQPVHVRLVVFWLHLQIDSLGQKMKVLQVDFAVMMLVLVEQALHQQVLALAWVVLAQVLVLAVLVVVQMLPSKLLQ